MLKLQLRLMRFFHDFFSTWNWCCSDVHLHKLNVIALSPPKQFFFDLKLTAACNELIPGRAIYRKLGNGTGLSSLMLAFMVGCKGTVHAICKGTRTHQRDTWRKQVTMPQTTRDTPNEVQRASARVQIKLNWIEISCSALNNLKAKSARYLCAAPHTVSNDKIWISWRLQTEQPLRADKMFLSNAFEITKQRTTII